MTTGGGAAAGVAAAAATAPVASSPAAAATVAPVTPRTSSSTLPTLVMASAPTGVTGRVSRHDGGSSVDLHVENKKKGTGSEEAAGQRTRATWVHHQISMQGVTST